MNSPSKHPKNVQRSMKDFTLNSAKSNKRTLSSRSPSDENHVKKTKYLTEKVEKDCALDTTIMSKSAGSVMTQSKKSTEVSENVSSYASSSKDVQMTPETTDTKLEGALGPLVQQIKLLRETFSDQYSRLDDKYTRLETVITLQKEMSEKLNINQ